MHTNTHTHMHNIIHTPTIIILLLLTLHLTSHLFTVCKDWDLRLVHGLTPQEGTVEVCFENNYGSICHDLWNENDAQVVCRQLGFSSENTTALRNGFYNSSSGPIHLNSVQCEGDELAVENCTWSREIEDCTHGQDAGVSCLGMCVLATLSWVISLTRF